MSEKLPEATSSIVPWRRTGVKYSTNEIYLDIIEEIDQTIDRQGVASLEPFVIF